jgi:SAM-dependent MidA family methyltransferase
MAPIPSLQQTLLDAAERSQGWLGFDLFMEQALLHPVEGYYSRSDRASGPFGASGDFITAPQMGPWMAGAMAQAFVRLQRESADPLCVLELGPGTGALAAQIMRELDAQGCLPEAYWLVEPSDYLRQVQAKEMERALEGHPRAANLLARCRWASRLAPEEVRVRGLVVMHEVLDALPVKCFEWQGPAAPVLEWGLTWHDGSQSWRWATRPATEGDDREVQQRAAEAEALGGWHAGHRSETAPGLSSMLSAVWDCLERGQIVVVDYGYERHELDHPDRHGGTVAAHLAHRRLDDPEDWIQHPGSRDLTAHVDFTAVARHFERLGACLLSLKSQAAWLLDHGVLDQAQQLMFPDPTARGQPPQSPQALHALSELQTLLSDAAMGQRFLVLSATKAPRDPV